MGSIDCWCFNLRKSYQIKDEIQDREWRKYVMRYLPLFYGLFII
jgi:hypothetical protein